MEDKAAEFIQSQTQPLFRHCTVYAVHVLTYTHEVKGGNLEHDGNLEQEG